MGFIALRKALPALLVLLAGCATEPVAPVRLVAPPPPRVMTMITEKGASAATAGSGIDAIALPLLMQLNVPTVDPNMVQSNRNKIQASLAQSGDEQGALEVGLQCGADVILSGHAEAQCTASQIAGSNLKSYQGTVNLRAICTDDARLLATASESATVIALEDVGGTAKSLQAASRKALEKIVPAMLQAWEKKQGEAATSLAPSLSLAAARGPGSVAEPEIVIAPPPDGHQPPVTALWPLTPQGGVNSNSIPIITDTLYAAVLKSQWFRLVTREDMAKILSEHKLQMSEVCDSSSRAAEFGKILNAEKMLIGTASKLGTTYQVVLKLVNVETGEIEKAGQAEAAGNVNVLMHLVKMAAADLLNKPDGRKEPAGGGAVPPGP
jgi:hypothetical protein